MLDALRESDGNGGKRLSFSRIAAFIICLIGMGLGIGSIATGLNGEPIIESGKALTRAITTEGVNSTVVLRRVAWNEMGEFWYSLCLGTALLVTALYGVNKGAEVLGKFATRGKGS